VVTIKSFTFGLAHRQPTMKANKHSSSIPAATLEQAKAK
jgi:hypothetical protein